MLGFIIMAMHKKRLKMSEAQKKRFQNPEEIKKRSETTKKLWQNPKYRKRIIESMRRRYENPEEIKKMKEVFGSPESRKRQREAMKKLWASPEFRKDKPIKSKTISNIWAGAVKIKAEHKCEYCGEMKSLNSHHIFGKRNANTKWDIENGICLCAGHHTFKTFSAHQSPEFIDWIKDYIGKERYERIRIKANQIKKWTQSEKREIYTKLKKYIREG